jgi:hypothetical protein
VTICYEETESDFTTPFTAGCSPTLTDCEPTRIHEGVRFDLLDELPKQKDWLKQLECRIEKCWKLFNESQFGKYLQKNADFLRNILCDGGEYEEGQGAPCELFCQLKGYLLLYLEKHPDQYNCRITKDISEINCPPQGEGDNYVKAVSDAFCKLLNLAYKSWISCLMGELIFPCAEPCEASCIVLGTVEIEDGELVRVCNCPRSYVWSFAHFYEVLVASILGRLACENEGVDTEKSDDKDCSDQHVCCRDFNVDCCCFMKLFDADANATGAASAAPLRTIGALKESLFRVFDFTRPGLNPATMFVGQKAADVEANAKKLEMPIPIIRSDPLPYPGLLETLQASILQERSQQLIAYQKEGRIVEIRPQTASEEILELKTKLVETQSTLATVQKRLDALETQAGVKQPTGVAKPKQSKK